MTDYGLQIRNSTGIIIIDSKYKNHVYHEHGRSFVQKYITEIPITSFSTSGLILTKPTSFFSIAYGFGKTGNNYDSIYIASDSTGYIDWIIYKEIPSVPAGEYGLNVFDSTGNIVFSSNEKGYFNVIQSYNYSQQELTVNDALNNYFSIIGISSGYSVNYVIDGGFKTTTITRRITGMKYVDSNTLDFDLFVSYITVTQEPHGGTGSGGLSSAYASVPRKLIEIKPPPGI